MIPAGVRYRNSQDDITVIADADGVASFAWPAAGRYWLEAEYKDGKAKPPATERSGVYVATFEVLPQ